VCLKSAKLLGNFSLTSTVEIFGIKKILIVKMINEKKIQQDNAKNGKRYYLT